MAARSPVLIGSSPALEPYRSRSISITPVDNTLRHSSHNAVFSSPGLASPSTFIRPRPPPALKGGSKAQQLPVGANTGFATAASIWAGEQDGRHAGREDDVEQRHELGGTRRQDNVKSAGKLTRPKKASTLPDKAAKPAQSPMVDSFMHSDAGSRSPKLPSMLPGRKNTTTAEGLEESEKPLLTRRPSISWSEYSFNGDTAPVVVSMPAKNAQAAEKPKRKRAAKAVDTGGKAIVAKKARKGHAKSEAIILNSDEPEQAATELEGHDEDKHDEQPQPAPPQAKKPRAKTVRAAETANSTESGTALKKPRTPRKPKAGAKATEQPKTSAYFAESTTADVSPKKPTPPPMLVADTIENVPGVDLAVKAGLPSEVAPRRRRSWTPAKDSLKEADVDKNIDKDDAMGESDRDEETAQVPLAELLGGFSYKAGDASVQRSISGEALTKRRRIEISETAPLPVATRLPPTKTSMKAPKLPKPPKKPKSPKKKPQTITALATAAYQPVKPPEAAQSTVSAFFTPQAPGPAVPPPDQAHPDVAGDNPAFVKPKKPRKPRAKPAATDGPATAKRVAKPKAKSKLNPADFYPPLLSPTGARKQLEAQDFLFGTSSQLAVEESPGFIRDMQFAISESEAVPAGLGYGVATQAASQCEQSPLKKSCAKVPTAPHGTCLSVEQTERELWCSASRDGEGNVLAQKKAAFRDYMLPEFDDHAQFTMPIATMPPILTEVRAEKRLLEEVDDPTDSLPSAPPPMNVGQPVEFASETTKHVPPDVFVDLSLTSPVAERHEEHTTRAAREEDLAQPSLARHSDSSVDAQVTAKEDDWMLLRSDDSLVLPHRRSTTKILTSPAAAEVPLAATPSLARSPSSCDRLPSSPFRRTALQPLDANASFVTHYADTKLITTAQKHSFVTPASDPAPLAMAPKPRGRPRKDVATTSPAPPSRGRPRKDVPAKEKRAISPKRARGRPRKDAALVSEPAKRSPTKASKEPKSLSQPSAQSEWANIDDISDPEPPTTPSPRRRRATSSPPALQPLDFEAPASPTTRPKAAPASTNLKPTDAAWQSIYPILYPQITQTIQSTPPSTSLATPTWHEKILLYDPIVLEDLTAWLNAKGLRTEVSRAKAKPKAKGRKKKDALAEPEVQDDELEIVREELKPWMVQKWCEENSVCCLWKDGLRGGVRGNY